MILRFDLTRISTNKKQTNIFNLYICVVFNKKQRNENSLMLYIREKIFLGLIDISEALYSCCVTVRMYLASTYFPPSIKNDFSNTKLQDPCTLQFFYNYNVRCFDRAHHNPKAASLHNLPTSIDSIRSEQVFQSSKILDRCISLII